MSPVWKKKSELQSAIIHILFSNIKTEGVFICFAATCFTIIGFTVNFSSFVQSFQLYVMAFLK